jgi:hypothetical protein
VVTPGYMMPRKTFWFWMFVAAKVDCEQMLFYRQSMIKVQDSPCDEEINRA